MNTLGIYIHMPFCAAKCPYCDFYSVVDNPELRARYTSAAERAVAEFSAPQTTVDTVYFGGGTPGLFSGPEISRLVSAVRNNYALSPHAEITLEINPGSSSPAKLAEFRAAGVNRLSVGVQSLSDSVLGTLGRRHNAVRALETIEHARTAGFENISADLIVGVPGQTAADIKSCAERLSAAGVSHISAYILKIEPDTPFHTLYGDNLPEDAGADHYIYVSELLEELGFIRYEISNFARDGKISRHNMKYWNCEEYIGIGPSAHSHYCGRRSEFARDLREFLTAENFGRILRTTDEHPCDFTEYAAMRIRLAEGLVFKDIEKRFGRDFFIKISEHMQEVCARLGPRYIIWEPAGIRLTSLGMLFENHILGELLF